MNRNWIFDAKDREQAEAIRDDGVLYVSGRLRSDIAPAGPDYLPPPEWVKATEPCENPWCYMGVHRFAGLRRCPDCIAGRPKITVRAPCKPNAASILGDGKYPPVPLFTCIADKIVPIVDSSRSHGVPDNCIDWRPERPPILRLDGKYLSRLSDLGATWPGVGPGWFAVLLHKPSRERLRP